MWEMLSNSSTELSAAVSNSRFSPPGFVVTLPLIHYVSFDYKRTNKTRQAGKGGQEKNNCIERYLPDNVGNGLKNPH